jgi:L-fucose mutarotase
MERTKRVLKGIDRAITAELLDVLMLMGHGDDLVICDVNHPAATIARQTTHGRLINLGGCGILDATRAILKLMPLDTFVDAPIHRMQVVDDPAKEYPLFGEMRVAAEAAEGRTIRMGVLERFAFYEAAKNSFAIVRTSDPGPYGCFILRKGVI